LLSHRNTDRVATCFYDSDGRIPEPLFTIWEPEAYPLLKKFQEDGKISPRDFLKTASITLLTIHDPKILTNINSADELNRFQAGQS
jgi:molybdopterin-guanine dinucleotide biosynthesis protein A